MVPAGAVTAATWASKSPRVGVSQTTNGLFDSGGSLNQSAQDRADRVALAVQNDL